MPRDYSKFEIDKDLPETFKSQIRDTIDILLEGGCNFLLVYRISMRLQVAYYDGSLIGRRETQAAYSSLLDNIGSDIKKSVQS